MKHYSSGLIQRGKTNTNENGKNLCKKSSHRHAQNTIIKLLLDLIGSEP